MPKKPVSRQFYLSILVFGSLACSGLAQTQNNWAGGNGEGLDWNLDGNWSKEAIPVDPTYFAQFLSGVNAEINVADGSNTARMTLDGNTSLELILAEATGINSTFTMGGLLRVGNTNAGAAHLTFSGPGSIAGSTFQVGSNSSTPGGNSLTFTGGVTYTSSRNNSASVVGRLGHNNHLLIEDAAQVQIAILHIGNDGGVANNHATITDEGTVLTVDDAGGNRGIRLGIGTGTNYTDAHQKNYVEVKDGAKVIVTSTGGNSSNLIYIGTGAYSHNNYFTIEGAGSILELGKGSATGGGTGITIGNTAGTSLGGNYMEVKDGGKVQSQSGHTGNISIHGHLQTGQNDGANRFTIGPDGSVELGGSFSVTGGMLQLSSSGKLTAQGVNVSNGGRFEAAGSDLATTTGTRIQTGSTLAIGLGGATSASLLTLKSAVAMEAGSTLELGLFGDGTMSGIMLEESGSFSISSTATIRLVLSEDYTPVAGSQWTVFTGEVGNITGEFNLALATLPMLGGDLEWDLTRFNENGGWQVAVIPEPGPIALVLLAGGMWLAGGRFLRTRQS